MISRYHQCFMCRQGLQLLSFGTSDLAPDTKRVLSGCWSDNQCMTVVCDCITYIILSGKAFKLVKCMISIQECMRNDGMEEQGRHTVATSQSRWKKHKNCPAGLALNGYNWCEVLRGWLIIFVIWDLEWSAKAWIIVSMPIFKRISLL